MSDEKRLVPVLRFKGFTDDWEQRKLGELAGETYGGGTPRTSTEEYWNGDIPWFQSSDLADGKIFSATNNKQISEKGLRLSATKLVPANSIAIITRVGVGKLAYMQFPYTTSQDFLSLSKLNSDPWFSVCTVYKKLQSELNAVQGTSIKGITKEELLSKEISLPSIEEQAQVGTVFLNLDELITLQQRKLEKLKLLKKAFLQQMFPQENELVPRLRLADFTCAWEQRKLGEIANIIGGGTPSTSNADYWNGDIDWYAPAEIGKQIYLTESQRKITAAGLENSSAKVLPIGTVLFTSRAGIGNTAILAKTGTTNQGFQSIVPHRNELDSYFIFSRTNELKKYGETVGAGSTFVEVSGKQMTKMPISIPAIDEQKQIGELFAALDNFITLHQRKLDALVQLKKAFLQRMFV